MRPPDEVEREFVQQWLAKAEGGLSVAKHLLSKTGPFLSTGQHK